MMKKVKVKKTDQTKADRVRQGVYSRDEVTHIGNRNEQIVIFRGAVLEGEQQ